MRLCWGIVVVAVGAMACAGGKAGAGGTVPDSTASAASAEVPEVPPLTSDDLARPWVRLAPPQNARVVPAATGFLGIFVDYGGKVGTPSSKVYRSDDGVTWRDVPLPTPPNAAFVFKDVAYGAGRYVLIGGRVALSGTSVVWSSPDLETWSPVSVPADPGDPPTGGLEMRGIRRVHDRFIGLGLNDIYSSADGTSWTRTGIPLVQAAAVAFGNGVFVAADALSIRSSRDGSTWDDHSPSCSLSGAACVSSPALPPSTPAGPQIPGPYYNAVFFDGRFYVDHVSSADGVIWESSDTPIANDTVGGWLFNDSGDLPTRNGASVTSLRAWQPGQPPTTIQLAAPAGETCTTNRCVIVDGALYLIR